MVKSEPERHGKLEWESGILPRGPGRSYMQDHHYLDGGNDPSAGQGIRGDRVYAHFPKLPPFTLSIKARYSHIVSPNKSLSISAVYVTRVIYDSGAAALY